MDSGEGREGKADLRRGRNNDMTDDDGDWPTG